MILNEYKISFYEFLEQEIYNTKLPIFIINLMKIFQIENRLFNNNQVVNRRKTIKHEDWDIEKLDPDLYAAEIMEVINTSLTEAVDDGNSTDAYIDAMIEEQESVRNLAEDNPEQARATAEAAEHQKNEDKLRFAHKKLSRSNLAPNGIANHSLDGEIIKAFVEAKGDMTHDHVNFVFDDGSLCSPTGAVYIKKKSPTDDLNKINEAAKDRNSAVFAEGDIDPNDVKLMGTYEVTDEFIVWLARQENWRSFAKGRFDDEMARLLAVD
jgi:hypothetical protein